MSEEFYIALRRQGRPLSREPVMISEPLLELEKVSVSVGGKQILRDVSLVILPGEVHVLMGVNGGGKTTLLQTVMGMPGYSVTAGRILFRGNDITGERADRRARLGIALSFQKPPAVAGVTLRSLTARLLEERGEGSEKANPLAAELKMESLLDRDLNARLSGGETKRSELLQLLAMKPVFSMFDEPESGVDLDSISLVGAAMARIMERDNERSRRGGMIVTHTGNILRYLSADEGHVLMGGTIICRGDPLRLFEDIARHGYEGCLSCQTCLPT